MKIAAAAAVVAATALLATGCSSAGGSSSSSSGSSSKSASMSPSMSMSTSPSGSASKSGSSQSSQARQGATITIKDFKYSGGTSVKAGSTVTVKNDDSVAHTVTADKGGAFDVTIPAGASKTFTAPKAGTYPYHCTYHSNMHGTLKVS